MRIAAPLVLVLAATSPIFAQQADAPAAAPKAKPDARQDAAPAPAQDAKPTIDPAASELIEKAEKAVRAIRDLSGEVEQEGPGVMGLSGRGRVTLTIPETRAGLPIGNYRVAILAKDGAVATEHAFDGTRIQKLDHAAKTLWTLETDDQNTMPPMDVWPVIPAWIFWDLIPNPEMKTVGATLLPDEVVDGTKCRVVRQVSEMTLEMPEDLEEDADPQGAKKADEPKSAKVRFTRTRFVGADDFLPRKVVARHEVEGNTDFPSDDAPTTTLIKGLKVNAGLKPADFVITAPEGFKSEKGTAEQMGIQVMGGEQQGLKVNVGDSAPAFSLKDASGKEYTLDTLKGRVVLMDFWATWCGPCTAAMPSIQKLHERFEGKPVSILGVNVSERKPDAGVKFMEKKKYTYPCLVQGEALADAVGVTGIPTILLIGPDGKVLHTGVGFGPGEEEHLAKMIEEQLAKLAK